MCALSYSQELADFRNLMLNRYAQYASHSTNLIVLITKQMLYTCKCANMKPNKQMIVNEIKFIQNMEKAEVQTKQQQKKFEKDGFLC